MINICSFTSVPRGRTIEEQLADFRQAKNSKPSVPLVVAGQPYRTIEEQLGGPSMGN